MFLSTEAPDELLYGGEIPGVFTGDGCVLEAVEDLPAGPWLAVLLDDYRLESSMTDVHAPPPVEEQQPPF
jgi:hypothetical protein